MTTGIAVFAYDRPDHLRRVLSGLRENNISHLYVFSDGPATESERPRVREVRTIIDKIEWCRTTVIERDENLGLAESLTRGIERVFRDHDRIIVLEDDCVPAPSFVSFVRTCLDRYENDDRVMSVNGYSPPINIPDDYPYDIYFTYRNSSWGWGTWKAAWEHFEQDPFTVDELETNAPELKENVRKAGRDLFPMMQKQIRGHIDSWAVWWSFAIASRDGVCVNPVNPQIRNIGHDGSGEHSGETERYDLTISNINIPSLTFPENVFVHGTINDRYNRFISGGRTRYTKRQLANVLRRAGLWDTYKRLTNRS